MSTWKGFPSTGVDRTVLPEVEASLTESTAQPWNCLGGTRLAARSLANAAITVSGAWSSRSTEMEDAPGRPRKTRGWMPPVRRARRARRLATTVRPSHSPSVRSGTAGVTRSGP